MSLLLIGAILAAVFAAAFIFFRIFFSREAEVEAQKVLGIDGRPRVVRSALLRLSRPFYWRLMPFTNTLRPDEWTRKKRRKIVAAGMTEEITAEELWAYKFFLCFVAVCLLFLFNHGATWYWWLIIAALGFFYPDRWLNERAALRAHQIVRALPNVVDMLALSVEAGMDFMGAIGRVVKKAKPNPLIEELNVMLGEMRMGATRADGLRNLAYRCDVRDLNSFVAILVQADKLGVSIGRVLRAQADKMRTDRFQKAERKGAQATQKILFPLILFIMPAVFIVIIGPLILDFIFRMS